MPGQGRYREVTSTSNTTDFQARRLDIRARAAGGKPEIVHTLNGTAVDRAPHHRAARERPARRRHESRCPAALHAYGVPAVLQSRRGLTQPRDRLVAAGHDVEGRVELRDLEQAQHRGVRARQDHRAAHARHPAQPVEQDAEPGGVDELDAGQVEDHAGLAVGDRGVQALGELRRRRRMDLAGDANDDGAVVERFLSQVEVGGLERHLGRP